jgi:signal transduction histidine kinase
MRVSHRLFAAVLPAVFGVMLVGALAYWGEYGRTAPGWLVVGAGVAALGSLALAWHNTRYVARRVERLVGPGGMARLEAPSGGPDELDSIEEVVDRLSSAVEVATVDRDREREVAAARVREYAALLAETSATVSRQLDEVRLPLQILLDNHFGTLNENQEEMLGAARQAADQAVVELGRLEQIASLDTGALTLRRDSVRLGDVLEGIVPVLRSEGARRGLEITLDVAPGLPRAIADRVRIREAFDLLLRYIVRHADPDRPIRIRADAVAKDRIEISVDHGAIPLLAAEIVLARRVLEGHGGTVELGRDRTVVALPSGAGVQG